VRLVEQGDAAVRVDEHRRRVARARPAQPGAAGPQLRVVLLEPGDQGGGHGVQVQAGAGLVEPGEQLGGRAPGVVTDAAQQPAQLAHRRRGPAVVADDVPDDQHGRAVGLDEGVVPVATDLGPGRRRDVPDDDLAVVRGRRRGQQAALQRLGQLPLLAEQPGLRRGGAGPTADLQRGLQLGLAQRPPARVGEQPQRTEGPAA
jgi:hypothetical protein